MALPGRTAGEIAAHLSGRVVGDGSVIPTAFCGVDNIEDGALVCIDDKKHLPAVLASGARVLVATEELASGKTEIIVADAKAAFYRLLDSFYPESDLPPGVSPKAVIAAGVNIPASVRIEENVVIRAAAVIGEGAIIQANTVVGEGCVLGENTRLYPNVTLYRRTVIGKNVIIHSGTVIGGDGFGYRVAPGGVREKIPQKGYVSIGDDVEIGANVTIDRSTLGPTIISNGVKIDNLVQVAHNCFIGENTVLVAQVGVAGSTRIGRNCIIAGQVGIADHCDIGDDVIIGAQGGVMSNVKIPPRSVYWGSPAQDMKDEKLAKLGSRKLYALVKFVEEKFSVKL